MLVWLFTNRKGFKSPLLHFLLVTFSYSYSVHWSSRMLAVRRPKQIRLWNWWAVMAASDSLRPCSYEEQQRRRPQPQEKEAVEAIAPHVCYLLYENLYRIALPIWRNAKFPRFKGFWIKKSKILALLPFSRFLYIETSIRAIWSTLKFFEKDRI